MEPLSEERIDDFPTRPLSVKLEVGAATAAFHESGLGWAEAHQRARALIPDFQQLRLSRIQHGLEQLVATQGQKAEDQLELANEFRAAAVAAQLEHVLPEPTSCDWCGTDVETTHDHHVIDKQQMCNPCFDQYFPDENNDRTTNMNDAALLRSYYSQQDRIQQLESWIAEVISKPALSREMRWQGLELVEGLSPDIRLAVERICPTRSQDLTHTLEQNLER
jgi:hypothetical protein